MRLTNREFKTLRYKAAIALGSDEVTTYNNQKLQDLFCILQVFREERMKIMGGKARGMNLFSPKGMNTRPITARVKQSLFNILSDDIEDAMVLDLFSGSGSIGLEAISQGAKFCTFFEQNAKSAEVLQKNIDKAKFNDQARIFRKDVFQINKLDLDIRFDICFYDPPYRYLDNATTRRENVVFLEQVAQKYGRDGGLIVIHFRKGAMSGVPMPKTLIRHDDRVYGSTQLLFLKICLGSENAQ